MSIIEAKKVTKRYDSVLALDCVDLRFEPGRLHALLGENGAGKSTLAKVLAGMHAPDSGSVWLNGRQEKFTRVADAIRAGVCLLPQDSSLVTGLTVEENLRLVGESPSVLIGFGAKDDVERILGAYPESLSGPERHHVELSRMMGRNPSVIICDEPTALLSPDQARQTLSRLKELAQIGKTVVVVTHRLGEVVEFADRACILRAGRVSGILERDEFSPNRMAALMFGEGRSIERLVHERPKRGPVRLSARGLEIRDSIRPWESCSDISFDLHEGEVLAICALPGNGDEAIFGALTGALTFSGDLRLKAAPFVPAAQRQEFAVASDARDDGAASDLFIWENSLLDSALIPPYRKGFCLSKLEMLKEAYRRIRRGRVSPTKLGRPTWTLSGGNRQKLVLSREFSRNAAMLFARNPTAGLDLQGVLEVSAAVDAFVRGGGSAILVTQDLDEALSMSDRIIALYRGRAIAALETANLTVGELGLLLSGHPSEPGRS